MNSLIDVQGLVLVLFVSFVGANTMVGAFGLFVLGVSRFGETRSRGKNGAPYAALAALGLLVCLGLLIVGFLAMIGKLS
jgi:hypothetical protein